MRRVAPHLQLAHRVHISNVWLFDDGEGGRWLIDTGHPLERPWLRRQLRRAGIGPGDLAGVLLTHRHSDHAGNAAFLRDHLRAPVYCHADDADPLSGARPPPRLARGRAVFFEELLCHIEDRWPARCPVDGVWSEGDWRGFHVTHAPGHTAGSSLLYHPGAATLFSGDAILSGVPPLRAFSWLRMARPGFSLDVDRCRAATRSFLADLPPIEALAAGHGPPVTRGARERLKRLGR